MSIKREFGDFQTPLPLARDVIELVQSIIGRPKIVIEPTAGLGAFLEAAAGMWGDGLVYNGYEINAAYVKEANSRLSESCNWSWTTEKNI